MSDSGEAFFRADKQTRNQVFSFKNQDDASFAAVIAGDQSTRVHPFPEMLGPQNGQKVSGTGSDEPAAGYTDTQARTGARGPHSPT